MAWVRPYPLAERRGVALSIVDRCGRARPRRHRHGEEGEEGERERGRLGWAVHCCFGPVTGKRSPLFPFLLFFFLFNLAEMEKELWGLQITQENYGTWSNNLRAPFYTVTTSLRII
jgi:hypothetical protein